MAGFERRSLPLPRSWAPRRRLTSPSHAKAGLRPARPAKKVVLFDLAQPSTKSGPTGCAWAVNQARWTRAAWLGDQSCSTVSCATRLCLEQARASRVGQPKCSSLTVIAYHKHELESATPLIRFKLVRCTSAHVEEIPDRCFPLCTTTRTHFPLLASNQCRRLVPLPCNTRRRPHHLCYSLLAWATVVLTFAEESLHRN